MDRLFCPLTCLPLSLSSLSVPLSSSLCCSLCPCCVLPFALISAVLMNVLVHVDTWSSSIVLLLVPIPLLLPASLTRAPALPWPEPLSPSFSRPWTMAWPAKVRTRPMLGPICFVVHSCELGAGRAGSDGSFKPGIASILEKKKKNLMSAQTVNDSQ